MGEWNAETAEWYAEKYGEYATNRLGADAIEVAPDAVVVDVGCGTGSALRRLASRVPQGKLIGLDPVSRMVAIAKEWAAADPNGARIELREAPAERLPLDDGCADVVLAFDSIDHWSDRAAGLSEVRRVLRPAGRFVVIKDGGLPGGAASTAAVVSELERAGFAVSREEHLAEGEVRCTMWICGLSPG